MSAFNDVPPTQPATGRYATIPEPQDNRYYPQQTPYDPPNNTAYDPPNNRVSYDAPPAPVTAKKPRRRISKKNQRRLYWVVPVGILLIIIVILFEVYKDDFERWAKPLTDWLTKRDAWSWAIPVSILVILSFPPLFGHEIVQIIVGIAYPLGIAIGIAIAGAILGEAACFIVFKLFGTNYVERKIQSKVKWAAIARVSQQAGFKGVLVIRYSIVPPHLANPLFACTGMSFWLYMITVILSLPKTIVFVVLGSPSSKNNKGVKVAKVIAVGVLVLITLFASWWIRKQLKVATAEIKAERGIPDSDDEDDESQEMETLPKPQSQSQMEQGTTAYQGGTAYHGNTAYTGFSEAPPQAYDYAPPNAAPPKERY